MEILLIFVTVLFLALAVLYFIQNSRLEYYRTISRNLSAMKVIQSMFEILGSNINSGKKIEELNSIIIESYSPKYSTISLYDGNIYEIKATNIDPVYYNAVGAIAEENDFKSNTVRNISKYLTTGHEKTLTYKSAIERNIRSSMFSPIYYNGMYLGFWLIEDEVENAFDNISKDELSKLKNNMGVFIENTLSQGIIENAENTDLQTGFYNNFYLYSNARQALSQSETSAVVMFYLKNLAEINDTYGRTVGNVLLVKTAKIIKESLEKDSMHIRYSGIRFLTICPNTDAEAIHSTVSRILTRIKNEVEYVDEKQITVDIQIVIHTFRKQNNIEKEVQKMVSYMDKMDETNTIKII